jgi:SAM-dependent methyltransferase
VSDGEQIRRSASARYAAGDVIWPSWDKWNAHKRREIERFCRIALEAIPIRASILNAGAGSHRYDWMPDRAVNLDRFPAQVLHLPNPIVGVLEALPFDDAAFDVIVCVGSVLNYASVLEAISELARVLKPDGLLILHYETSDSAEHFGTPIWRRDVAPLRTVNNGEADMVWVYSRGFVRRTLARNGIAIGREEGFHIASAGLLRFGFTQQAAAAAAMLDRILTPLSVFADDVILTGRKYVGRSGVAFG